VNWINFATIVIGAIITVAPQLIITLPSPYRDAATAVLAAAVALYHLWVPSSSQQKSTL
jgi:hypothetical protein